jgi:hypothetical protein
LRPGRGGRSKEVNVTKLQDVLLEAARRTQVIDDCTQLVDDEVATKGGLSGMAVKGAYAIVKKIKPGIVREVVDKLLDEFVGELAPFYADFQQKGGADLQSYLQGRAAEVATGLLKITDGRAARADNRTIKAAYERLRPTGAKHVEAAVPGIARVLGKYV